MFVTTLVFAKLVTWMRGQSGTSDLRALAYMDEVAGYVPPTAAPPAKKPILTILKQGRAFGLGLVLSTQNPGRPRLQGDVERGHLARRAAADRERQGARARGPALGRGWRRHLGARLVDRRAAEAPVHARLGQGLTAARVLDAVGDVVPARPADEGAGAAADERRAAPGRGAAGGGSGAAAAAAPEASPGRPARRRRDIGGACRRSRASPSPISIPRRPGRRRSARPPG